MMGAGGGGSRRAVGSQDLYINTLSTCAVGKFSDLNTYEAQTSIKSRKTQLRKMPCGFSTDPKASLLLLSAW